MKDIIKEFARYLYDNLNIISSFNALNVDGFNYEDNHCLYINKIQNELYCLELSSTGNVQQYVVNDFYDDLFKEHKDSKNGNYITAFLNNKYHQKVYVFSSNKELLESMSFGIGADFIDSREMMNVLYDLFLEQEYYIDYKTKKREVELSSKINYANLTTNFNNVIRNCVYKNIKDITIYQAYRNKEKNKKIDFARLFSLKWHGVIWNYVDVTEIQVLRKLENLKSQAGKEGKDKMFFEGLIEDYKNDDISLAIKNTTIFLKKKNKKVVQQIGRILNCDFREKEIFKRTVLLNTPIKKRDRIGDCIVEKETTLYNSLASCHKQEVPKPNFYAFDINGAFWDFNFSQTTKTKFNKNSDFIIIGIKGTGKTTSTNGIIARLIGFDLERIVNLTKEEVSQIPVKEIIKEFDEQFIRDFDIKESGRKLFNQLKKVDSNEIIEVSTSLNSFKYNPFNIRTFEYEGKVEVDENELVMSCLLLSITLEAKSKGNENAGLSIGEEDILKDCIKGLYNKPFEKKPLRYIKKEYPEIFERLKKLGYCEITNISEIKEKEFDFLKKPILENVLKEVKIESKMTDDKERAREAETLIHKLKNIDSLRIFSGFDSDNLPSAKYLYMDFEPIKGTTEFVPIFLALFNKMFYEDKKRQRAFKNPDDRPYITYKFEEAVNLFIQPSFKKYLETFINEARSDRIKAGFVAQKIEQVPSYIYGQVTNKFLLFPAENQRAGLINDIVKVMKPNEETIELMNKTPEYGVLIWNEHGTSVIKLPMSQVEIDVYGQSQ